MGLVVWEENSVEQAGGMRRRQAATLNRVVKVVLLKEATCEQRRKGMK